MAWVVVNAIYIVLCFMIGYSCLYILHCNVYTRAHAAHTFHSHAFARENIKCRTRVINKIFKADPLELRRVLARARRAIPASS